MNELFTFRHELPSSSFERLLLFAGLLPPRLARRETLPETQELSELLLADWQRLGRRAWPWRLRESTARLVQSSEDALRLIGAGDELLTLSGNDWDNLGRGLRIELNVPDQFPPLDLYNWVLNAGAHSAFLRWKNEGEMAWSWPLRIGIPKGSDLLSHVDPGDSLWPLFQTFNYERAPMRANVLLFETSLLDVKQALVNSRSQTDSIIIFGGSNATDDLFTYQTLSNILKATGAQGIFVFDGVKPDQTKYFATGIIAHLSHDQPLDSAVARLAKESGATVLSCVTRRLAEASSVREQGRMLAQRLKKMGDVGVRLPADVYVPPVQKDEQTRSRRSRISFGLPKGKPKTSARQLGAVTERRLESQPADTTVPPLQFQHEHEAARELAALESATARQIDLDAARREDRHLQARVETPTGRVLTKTARMRRSRDYVASVFIGALNTTFLSIQEVFEAPQPPDGGPLYLDVLFWEPQASPKVQVAQLILPPQGDSGFAMFPFTTAENQSFFSARIAVYHRNRNLQTGLLQGTVGDEPAELSFTLDAAPLTKFVGLTDRAGVDASMIINDDASGNTLTYLYANGQASVADVSDEKPPLSANVNPGTHESLSGITEVLGRVITRISDRPDDYKDLSKDGSRTLLLELAQHGSGLRRSLRKHTEMDLFDNVHYIQIVSAHPNAFFPVEYIYDGVPPRDTATVCDGTDMKAVSEAILSGTCCGAYEKNKSGTICPVKFWSLTKVIERHAHIPKHNQIGSQFQLRSDPVSARNRVIDPLRCAVLAASQDAAAEDKDAVTKLCTDINAVLRNEVVPVTNWESLEKGVEKTRPKLLILLPHHEYDGGFNFLEIGGDKLKSVLIGEQHVRAAEDAEARPVVLLIGCKTNLPKVEMEGFVLMFQDAGAEIIVSTIATILGRHAAPTAAAIVEELKKMENNTNATFGDVMLAVRRRLLAAGIPMVLGLTSYGDADSRIRAEPGEVT